MQTVDEKELAKVRKKAQVIKVSAAKEFIKMILRLFTQANTNVCAGYVEKLLPVFRNADARMMLLSFANREVTHQLGYKRLNDTLGYDSEEFMSEFLAFEEMQDKKLRGEICMLPTVRSWRPP